MTMIQRRIIISGKVQGVGFRQSLMKEVEKYREIRGYVRNLADGKVEAVVVGPDDAVQKLVSWCKTGPSQARVSNCEVIFEKVDASLGHFHMRR